jgi:hypothetical protein
VKLGAVTIEGQKMSAQRRAAAVARIATLTSGAGTSLLAAVIFVWQAVLFAGSGEWTALPLSKALGQAQIADRPISYVVASSDAQADSPYIPSMLDQLLEFPTTVFLLLVAGLFLWLFKLVKSVEQKLAAPEV